VALDSNVAISNIRENMGILRCTTGQVQPTDALRYLDASQPAHLTWCSSTRRSTRTCSSLPARCWNSAGWLADDAWVYTESETAPSTLGLPGNWRLHREQKAGRRELRPVAA
jgi:16S rRNA (guanine966-N2)-methyltransferase